MDHGATWADDRVTRNSTQESNFHVDAMFLADRRIPQARVRCSPSHEPLKTLFAPSEQLEGSSKRFTFEILAEVAGDGTDEVELDSDLEPIVLTVMGELGDQA